MSSSKLEIQLRPLIDSNGNTYYMGNNDMDTNIMNTVFLVFISPENDKATLIIEPFNEKKRRRDTNENLGNRKSLNGNH